MLPQAGIEPASPQLLVGRDDNYTTGATTVATWPPYEVSRILRGHFMGRFSFRGIRVFRETIVCFVFHEAYARPSRLKQTITKHA